MENLPMKTEKIGFFSKIKNFFKNLFKGKEKNTDIKPEQTETINNDSIENKKAFKEYLQHDIKEQEKKDKILLSIREKKNSIYNLSNEQLKQLIKIYEDKINKIDMEIKRLKGY